MSQPSSQPEDPTSAAARSRRYVAQFLDRYVLQQVIMHYTFKAAIHHASREHSKHVGYAHKKAYGVAALLDHWWFVSAFEIICVANCNAQIIAALSSNFTGTVGTYTLSVELCRS